jgi:hypothetical protein
MVKREDFTSNILFPAKKNARFRDDIPHKRKQQLRINMDHPIVIGDGSSARKPMSKEAGNSPFKFDRDSMSPEGSA